jgi:protein-L-isoaspartate(D-aspartate) O-methyltransferase
MRRLAQHIRDERVIAAVASVPRELFVPPELAHAAWRDRPLPIGSGQTISQPLLVARMCELLELGGDERVLDVGTGSGYHAALLARLSRWVWSIERHPELSRAAAASLEAAGIENVTLLVGDGSLGHPAEAPYDAINVAAAAPDEQALATLESQLAPGGRMIAPVGRASQRLELVRKTAAGIERKTVGAVRFVPLV